jgi:type IV secretion system protein VirB5
MYRKYSASNSACRDIPFLVLATACCLIASPARAQWHVVDEQANKQLQTITQTLDKIYHQQGIGSYRQLKNAAPDPSLPLTDPAPTQDSERCQSLPPSQQANCLELAQTRNAQMAYMHQMYQYAQTRNQQLMEIEEERASITSSPDTIGLLENNTNQLMALNTQLAIDRQQLESAMNAYQARIDYLKEQQAHIASAAITGSSNGNNLIGGTLGNVVNGAISAVVLKTALQTAKSTEPKGIQRLGIEQSNGW